MPSPNDPIDPNGSASTPPIGGRTPTAATDITPHPRAEVVGESSATDSDAPVSDSAMQAITLAFSPPLQVGELGTLGDYRIVRELGRGEMGAVFLAIDSRLQRKVAHQGDAAHPRQ